MMNRSWVIMLCVLLLAACAEQQPQAAASPTGVPATPEASGETATLVETVPPATTTAATSAPAPTATVIVEDARSTPVAPTATVAAATSTPAAPLLEEYPVPTGSHPHDVAPAPDGAVWYTAQHAGELGRLNPATGETHHIPLGEGSAPHGVIVGPDGAPWITDGGLNAIVRVDPETEAVQLYPLPDGSGYANLNTATFDDRGVLWFTGQSGIYGRLDPTVGEVEVFDAPRGRGPYGIAATPGGVYYASLAGSHIARVDGETATATPLEPPTPGQGARRVWPDSQGRIWVSEWNAGQVAVYDPANDSWREWRLPGERPQAYAVFVDEQEMV